MDLEQYRIEIDSIDKQLLDLIQQRMEVSRGVAGYKLKNNMEILQPEREKALLERMASSAKEQNKEYVHEFFTEILRISRQIQTEIVQSSTTK